MICLKNITDKLVSVFIFCAFILTQSCSSGTNTDCQKHKNGDFIYRTKTIENEIIINISRQNSIQLETDRKTGYYSKFKVNWTSDCAYELLLEESTFPAKHIAPDSRKTDPLKVEILNSTDDFYIFKAYKKDSPVLIDTIWVDHY